MWPVGPLAMRRHQLEASFRIKQCSALALSLPARPLHYANPGGRLGLGRGGHLSANGAMEPCY